MRGEPQRYPISGGHASIFYGLVGRYASQQTLHDLSDTITNGRIEDLHCRIMLARSNVDACFIAQRN